MTITILDQTVIILHYSTSNLYHYSRSINHDSTFINNDSHYSRSISPSIFIQCQSVTMLNTYFTSYFYNQSSFIQNQSFRKSIIVQILLSHYFMKMHWLILITDYSIQSTSPSNQLHQSISSLPISYTNQSAANDSSVTQSA